MKTTVVVLLLMLAGCAATEEVDQKPRNIVTVGTKVEVGVREKCTVVMPPEPVWQTEITKLDKNKEFEASKAITAELEQARGYIKELKAAAIKCQ